MKTGFASKLACPECKTELSVSVFKEGNIAGFIEVEEGIVVCNHNHVYPIVKFIPRMLPSAFSDFPDFTKKYEDTLKQRANILSKSEFERLQEKTKKSFRYEWQKWNKFGWGDAVSLETTKNIFDYKVLFTKEELKDKLLLDAGCGNGRYSKIARDYGAEVIGIDLSEAIDEAFENFKGDPHIHFVQGDLFKLPFKENLFDYIFSNGVLMHTGNAKKAFLSLVSKLSDQGVISVHLYHKGNLLYEFNDWWLRVLTTRLPFSVVYHFSRVLAFIARILPKKFVIYGLNAVFRIEAHPHYVFDWYTAPIATHHTYKEVYGWLKEANLHLMADHNSTRYPWRRWIFPFQFLTVKAKKGSYATNNVIHSTH